jgi:hypothetical protein
VVRNPTLRWLQLPFEGANTQLPWTAVLDQAGEWAHGARTLDEAATLVTHGLRNIESTLYVTYNSSPFYSEPNFDWTGFLSLLRTGEGRGSKLNCSDCATAVSTFADVLGCNLWQSPIGTPKPF